MTGADNSLPPGGVRTVTGGRFLRGLNRILPLGRKYHPLLRALNGRHGLLAMPFDQYHLLQPAAWSKSVTAQMLSGSQFVPEFEVIKPICCKLTGGVLVDVGANIGAYTLLLRSVSPLRIVAYEPQPFLFKLLRCTIGFNQLTGVEARNVACGRTRGEVPFSVGLNGSVVRRTTPTGKALPTVFNWEQEAELALVGVTLVNVPVTTLDEDLADAPAVALLKIDCEGYEYDVLEGAANVIRRDHPRLALEVHPTQLENFGHSTEKVLDLVSRNYDLEFWSFQIGRHATKLAHSLAKFRRPKAHRYADAAEMLAAARSTPGPAQIYFIGKPR